MSLLLPVLVRGINNLSDARYCAGMGADGLIFTLDPNLPGAVTPELVKELAGWVSGVELVGEFDTMPESEISWLVAECSLQSTLLHHLPLTPFGARPLLYVPLFMVASDKLSAEMILRYSDTFPAGFGVVVQLEAADISDITKRALATVATHVSVWLGGAITPANARPLVEAICPAGLILQGGDEIKPGLRDFTELEAIFEALEVE